MKKVVLFAFSLLLLNACVAPKIHNELQSKYKGLEAENVSLRGENDSLKANLGQLTDDYAEATSAIKQLKEDTAKTGIKYRNLKRKYRDLNKNYEFLLENNNQLMASNQAENKKLMAKLAALQKELYAKEDSLLGEKQKMGALGNALKDREARVNELEQLIAAQQEKVNAIETNLKKALYNFEGKGLTVEIKNGKVYVSLENSLLFGSGSWKVDGKGKEALQELSNVLAENKDLNVLVEGHTDSDAFNGATVKDNWDLSVMRATAIVKIITANKEVDASMITAGGRSEYVPIADNESAKGKAKNRRTEIIITPNLGAIQEVLSGGK